jgi:hypothetical protein
VQETGFHGMRYFTRRHFLRGLIGLFAGRFFSLQIPEGRAQSSLPGKREEHSIGHFFKGEELSYDIGFWIFKRAAMGTLTLKETEKRGQYLATLQGETLGFLGWIARYRKDTYRAVMEEVEGGRCFRGVSFEEEAKIGARLRRRTHLFDYEKRKWIRTKRNKDGTTEKTEEEIPAGMIYNDFITASYNFRYGSYGAIERGRNYFVPTFPRKGPTSYEVRVASKEEEERRRTSEKPKAGRDFFVKLILDPEVTHSKEGIIEGWLSKDLCPMEGMIRDVFLFGDVRGTLVKNNRG